MGPIRTGYKILISIFCMMPGMAIAQPAAKPLAPLNMEAKYLVAWNGITIGRINVTSHEDAGKYSLTVDTKTHGIATIFATERRIADANGTVQNGHYTPVHFESRPQDKDAGRVTTLTYAHGIVSKRSRVPDDDLDWRPAVTAEQTSGSTDPISAGFNLRHMLYAAQQKPANELSIKTYDGARLAEMKFTLVKPAAKVEAMGTYRDTVTTLVARQPIAGYTPKELKTYNKGDPVIHLYFSADEKLIPLRATASTLFGELSATLVDIKN